MKKVKTLADLIPQGDALGKSKISLSTKENSVWRTYSVKEIRKTINRYSTYLNSVGIGKGTHVVLTSDIATAEWLFLDLAIQQLGAVSVFIYPNLPVHEFARQLKVSDASIVFFQSPLRKEIIAEIQSVARIFIISAINLETIDDASEGIHNEVSPDQLSTIIFTSGTSGTSKGVMLSHENIISNIHGIAPLLPVDRRTRVMSILPYSHAFERTVVLTYLMVECAIYLPGSREDVEGDYRYARPTFVTAVPRMIEKLYDRVVDVKSQKSLIKSKLIERALKVSSKEVKGGISGMLHHGKLLVSKHLIFRKFRSALGGQLKAIIVGAAHLNPKYSRTFAAAGIPLREGYGMTEASPVISVNRFTPGLNKIGTVGLPLNNVKVRIERSKESESGEIMVKGPNVMMGYYKDPKATSKVMTDDGWLHTGDVGRLIDGKYLQITDRKKSIFKTSTGKYVAPSRIEYIHQESEYIEQIVIIGFQRPYLTALVYPQYDRLKAWCEKNNIHWTSPKYMSYNIKVKGKVLREIKDREASLENHEKVRSIYLLDHPLSVEEGTLSSAQKYKRHHILDHYSKEIEGIYYI